MDINLLLPLLITAIFAIVGWFVAHYLSSNRERARKRHDLRVQYLIEAWRRLENASNRHDDSRYDDLERAIADIQLFGSREQIELAQRFAEDFVKNGSASLDELLEDLRQDLRKELRLESVPKNIKYLRIISSVEHSSKK